MELTGSMLMACLVTSVVSFLLLIVAGFPMDGSVVSLTRFAWLALTSLVGTWAVLMLSKLWEGAPEDTVRRRFVQVLIGLGVGAVAFAAQQYLDPRLVSVRIIDTPQVWSPSRELFASDGSPQFPAFLVYFAGLFMLLRWWHQADPLRESRFSLWSVISVTVVALVWQIFWPFTQPWGLMVPATMSVALQLSSPWVNASARQQCRRLADNRLSEA
jgi:hypothetical protein